MTLRELRVHSIVRERTMTAGFRANCLNVIASAAKQSISQRKERMDCFVARAPRNDVERSVGALDGPRADDDGGFPRQPPQRHCERSEAIYLTAQRKNGLLRRKSSSQ
jgi:hypothetical protein